MKFKIEKNLRILNELVTYYHTNGCDDVHIDVINKDDCSYFNISGKIESFSKEQFDKLDTILNAPRQHEVEQYYWHLGGNTELECELTLVGAMVDSAIIEFKDNVLSLKIKRNQRT